MSMPTQKPGRSKQDYQTPDELIAAVERRFGAFHVDLAARADNKQAPMFISPQQDALSVYWGLSFPSARCWLNPPFADIEPWARKAALETAWSEIEVFMLTPASVGSNWFAEHVHRRAYVLALSPRLTFVGAKDPYPKDCILSCYGARFKPGFDVWRWA